jgi:hypothetical protein
MACIVVVILLNSSERIKLALKNNTNSEEYSIIEFYIGENIEKVFNKLLEMDIYNTIVFDKDLVYISCFGYEAVYVIVFNKDILVRIDFENSLDGKGTVLPKNYHD